MLQLQIGITGRVGAWRRWSAVADAGPEALSPVGQTRRGEGGSVAPSGATKPSCCRRPVAEVSARGPLPPRVGKEPDRLVVGPSAEGRPPARARLRWQATVDGRTMEAAEPLRRVPKGDDTGAPGPLKADEEGGDP